MCHHLAMDPAVHRPLIRADGLRALLASALALTAFAAAPIAWFLTIFGLPSEVVFLALCVLVATPFAGSAIVTGRWSRTPLLRIVQIAAVALVLASGLLIVAVAGSWVLDALDTRDTLGTALRSAAPDAAWAAAAVLGCALVLASIPLPLGRRAGAALVAGVVAVAAVLGLGAAVLHAGPQGCGHFRFDRERWQADVPRGGSDATLSIAAALVRCRTLDGAPRAEVRALLGRPNGYSSPSPASWSWNVGTVNDGIGPGDGEFLTVTFRRDRVRGARLFWGS